MPLRERPSDILPLAAHLLERLGYRDVTLGPDAQQALVDYHWPGNVRELKNVVERSIYRQGNPQLPLADLVTKEGDTSYHAMDLVHPSVKGSRAIAARIAALIGD